MKKLALTLAVLALPVISSAQTLGNISTLVTSIGSIIEKIIPIMFAIALIGFFWGLIRYIFGQAQDKEQAKKIMIWGVVALFVMASVWGLVRFIGTAIGITPGSDAAPSVDRLIPR